MVAERWEVEDAEALVLTRHRDELPATLAHPPHERLLQVFDKLELARAGHPFARLYAVNS